LTIKTFALSSIVAYLGLSLSAFVYVPFGEYIMATVHTFMLKEATKSDHSKADAKVHDKAAEVEPVTAITAANISSKLNVSRLQNQMFAYTVTNQIVNTFLEVGLPFILRGVGNVRAGKGLKMHSTPATDDKAGEQTFIEDLKLQATLPQYELFSE
jgi:anoctamin-10